MHRIAKTMKLSRLVCFFCCLPVLLTAGDGYRFRYIDLPEALRDATINGATADRAGLLWFFTSSGLHRFDGNQVLTFNHLSTPAINGNSCTMLFADSRNRLWIGSQSGLTRFDLENWRTQAIPLKEERGVHVTEICEGRDGEIYVASNEGKFLRVRGDELEVLADLGSEHPFNPTRAAIMHLQEVAPGQFWILSAGRLLQIDKHGRLHDPGFPANVSTPVHFYDPEHAIFMVNGRGLFEGNIEEGELRPLPAPFSDTVNQGKRTFAFSLTGGDVGVFINKRGFFTYDPATHKGEERMKGLDLSFANLRASAVKSSGNRVFISFNKSVAELQQVSTPFSNLLVNPSFEVTANSVRSILKHPDGLLYMGTYSNGFISLNETTGEKKVLGHHFVYASMLWDDGRLLLATEGSGLQWYHVAENRFEALKPDTLHTPYDDRVHDEFFTSLTRENDSLVWVGGYNGVFLLNTLSGHTAYVREGPLGELLRRAKVYLSLIHI